MSKEGDGQVTVAELWVDLLKRHPIVDVFGVVYNEHPHNTRTINYPTYLSKRDLLECDPTSERWPFIRPLVNSNVVIKKNKIYAMGPLVYLWPPDKKIAPGCEVMSFLMIDLDLPKNPKNSSQVISVLESDFHLAKWALIDSGNSYHVIFDALIPPKNIPWHFGDIIKKFAKISQVEDRQLCENFGNDIQKFWNNPEKLTLICGGILSKVTHYDDPKAGGVHFPVDLRWMAHSILELINREGNVHGTFGYLRVNKKRNNRPPVVIAKSIDFD